MRRVGVVALLLASTLLAAQYGADQAVMAQPVGKVRVDYVPIGVPQHMNLQGYLTDASGTPITDTLPMVFKIWRGGSAVWTENQNNCAVLIGLFSVGLGSATPIPFSVFEPGTPCSLEVTVNSEALPKVEITSVGFAYRSVKSDTAVYAQSSAGGPPSGPAGGSLAGSYPNPTLAANAVSSSNIVDGSIANADISASAGIAQSKISNTARSVDADMLDGYHANNLPSPAHNHLGETWSSSTSRLGLKTVITLTTDSMVYGKFDSVSSSGAGNVYGGYFSATGAGTCDKYGLVGVAYNPTGTDQWAAGVTGMSYEDGTNGSAAGYFIATTSGTSDVRGVGARAGAPDGTDVVTQGLTAHSENRGAGWSNGAWIEADRYTTTTGPSTGATIKASTATTNSNYRAIGIDVEGRNTGNGATYGGKFLAAGTGGTGPRYGVYSELGSGGSPRYAGYYVGDHVITGTKSAAVKLAEDDWRLVYCQESPELWFEDFGEAQLVNGQAHVELEPTFLRTVTVSATQPMKVFVELNDDCSGVFVQRGQTGFDVIERESGKSSAHFTYRVVAKRKGYENLRLHRMEPGTNPDELQAENARLRAQQDDWARKHAAKANN